jgi:hypothetical protein
MEECTGEAWQKRRYGGKPLAPSWSRYFLGTGDEEFVEFSMPLLQGGLPLGGVCEAGN